jgi:uncharacterized protein YeaO (DUF488 family)
LCPLPFVFCADTEFNQRLSVLDGGPTCRFCKDVDAKDLSISVSSGRINLKNVEVKPSAFDDLKLPITVKSGRVGSIEIQVSWTKLTSSPIVVIVKDIYVVACPNAQRPPDADKSAEELREERRALLLQEMEQHKIELLANDTNDGVDAGMAKKILNNLQLSIENVHVRYEQEAAEFGKAPVVLGIRLDKFAIASTNAKREPIQFLNDQNVLYKKAELLKLRVYVHNRPPELAQAETDGNNEDALLLKRFSATAWLTLVNKGAVQMKKPKMDVELECEPLHLALSKNAVSSLVEVVKTGVIDRARAPFLALRPKVGSYRGHYRVWWQYACGRALDVVRLKRQQRAISHVRRCISVAVRYSKLYKRALGVLPLTALSKEEMDEFTVIQDTEPLAFLRLVREQANRVVRAQVKKLLVEAALTPQPKKGMMARMFGSSKKVSKVTVGGEEVELTDEQLQMMKELATSAAQEASEEESDLGVSPEEYVAQSFSLSVKQLCVDVVSEAGEQEEDCGTPTCVRIARAFLSQVTAQFAQRKQGFRADLRLGELGVHGASEKQKVLFIDYSRASKSDHFQTGTSTPHTLTRELTYAHPDQQKNTSSGKNINMMALSIDSEPLSGDADVAIAAEVRPCYLNLSFEFATVLGDWVRDVQGSYSNESVLAEQTRARLSKAAERSYQIGEDFAKIYAAPEKRVQLKIKIEAPTVLMPCLSSGLDSDADSMSLAALNLGTLSINTTTAEVTTGLQWSAVGTCSPQGGVECKNAKLAQALLKKQTEFILVDLQEFGVSEQLSPHSYVQVGDTFFQPTASNGDRFVIKLEKANVHLCSTDDFDANALEDARFKLFQTSVLVELEIDKPCPKHPHFAVAMKIGAIDICLTKAHVLHALALQETLDEMFPSSDDAKARKKKALQGQQIQRHQIGLVRQVIKTKLADIEKRAAGEDVSEPSLRGGYANVAVATVKEKAGNKTMEVKVMVDCLSVTFQATPREEQNGNVWLKSVTPTQSLRLKVEDFEMQMSAWDTKTRVLKARLHAVSLQHLDQDTSRALEMLATAQHSASMRRLLEKATWLEDVFTQADAGGDGTLDLGDVRQVLERMGLGITDDHMRLLTKAVDENNTGVIEKREFVQLAPMLCSRSPLDGHIFTMPLPSDLANQPEKDLLSVTMEEQEDMRRTSFKMARVELTVSSIPLRNAADWIHLLQKSHIAVQVPAGSEGFGSLREGETQHAGAKEVKAPGIAALRSSFESDSEDIFIPPKLSSILTVEIEEIDVAVHDMLVGHGVLFFRAGPLSLALSAQTPHDDKEPYRAKMQVVLQNLRVLYGQSVHDVEWDLTSVVSETALSLSNEDSMPQDLSGATKEQRLEIGGIDQGKMGGIRLEVSLKQLLFLQALQKVFSTVNDGIAGLQSLAQSEQQATQPSSKVRQLSRTPTRAGSMQGGAVSEGSVKIKFQHNIAKLSRSFKCSSIELTAMDDVRDLEAQDAGASVGKVKLLQCRMSDIEISEMLGDKDAAVSAVIGSFSVQAQAVGDSSDMETLLEPFPLRLDISTSRFSTKQEIVFEIPSIEMTITPDHINRPRETMRRFDRLAKKQQLMMKRLLQDMQAVLKKMGEVGEREQVEDGNNKHNMLTFLSNLSPGEKRLIRNRTSCALQCRIYPAADCDTLKRPVMNFVLVPGGSVKVPTTTLATGVLLMQPCRNMPAEATDPTSGAVWLNAGDTEPTSGEKLQNAALADALSRKTQFTAEEWSAFGIKGLLVGHYIKAVTGSYFKPAPTMIKWAMGTWSKPGDLRLDAWMCEGEGVGRFLATVHMEVQMSMQASKVEAILTDKGPKHKFLNTFASAVSVVKNVERVQHGDLKRNGANLLVIVFSVTVGSNSEMGGILFDCCAGLTHERLAAALKSSDLIEFEHDLCIVKEPTFMRIVDCQSVQMADASLVVSSDPKMVLITAPWKLSNMLPKLATFKVFASAAAQTPMSTQVLEAGQKVVCHSHVNAEAGVFVEVEMDGYTSPRRKVLRKELQEECPLKHTTNGESVLCLVDMACVGNSAEFVVTFYMRMVVINRTGLNLSFGCCRLAGPQDGKKGARKREEKVPRVLAEPNMLNTEKVSLYAYVLTYVCNAYIHACIHTYYVRTYIYTYMHTYIHTYAIHAHVCNTHIHTYTHTHMYIQIYK